MCSTASLSGRVTDFLLFYIGDYQWPTFNVADSAIVIGSGLLLLDIAPSQTAGGPMYPEIFPSFVSPHLRRAGGAGLHGGPVARRAPGPPRRPRLRRRRQPGHLLRAWRAWSAPS